MRWGPTVGISKTTTARNTPVHAGTGTPQRSIRIPDELWQAALQKASERGDTLNDVIRQALERYIAEAGRPHDPE